MKKKEKKGLFEWLPENLEFINDGVYGKWKKKLSKKMVDYIIEKNKNEMIILDYL